ncbi:hypothetical protein VJ918_06790 [Adlercreutzia sp. R21]|uniref:Uncharacterized protein n=1 Tax=Adlercreutzia wanghongyangiae TaxID=3111451 RepID=A0ABU6IFE7_9ACTN|nr:hypothetical protein [Adlercreutzia sp. R21]MEC4175159.1 hypothetical protein [Adlercreutzia sp. R7]MEC4184514.1 hypothetical protein [Adlercreutzia sp. R21]
MKKSNWLVAALAVVASAVLLGLWFQLGFNHVDDPVDIIVAVVWWAVVAGVIAAIMWAEHRRREKMRLAFIGAGLVYNPERGLVLVDEKDAELDALQETLQNMSYPTKIVELADHVRPAFRWVVRSQRFENNGEVWEGEVLPAHDPDGKPVRFSGRDELAHLIAA